MSLSKEKTDTQRGHVKTDAEAGGMQPQAKECLAVGTCVPLPLEAGNSFFLSGLQFRQEE